MVMLSPSGRVGPSALCACSHRGVLELTTTAKSTTRAMIVRGWRAIVGIG
jgi:hypothetical protein